MIKLHEKARWLDTPLPRFIVVINMRRMESLVLGFMEEEAQAAYDTYYLPKGGIATKVTLWKNLQCIGVRKLDNGSKLHRHTLVPMPKNMV